MGVLQTNCPGCGGPVEFKSGQSVVVVCGYCRSLVARTDRAVEDLGKVAEVMDTGSPLDLGARGQYKGVGFELTGRAQLGHQAGGRWDEWYATFSNGWLGWLAEAQGRFYMTFEQTYPGGQAPPFQSLQPGQPLPNSPHKLVVAETGRATYLSAKGEIPYVLRPGQQYDYADLQGPNKVFGTLDYSEAAPIYFLGQEVTLEDLGIKVPKKPKRQEAKRVASGHLNCPNCGGGLELRAPDQTERVTCPNCNGLLDVNQGRLKYLKTLNQQPFTPFLPLGAKGATKDGEMTVIGAMMRSVTFDQTYYWGEYLLYNPAVGFRWMVHSDNHWNYVSPLRVAEVTDTGATAIYNNQTFKIFQDTTARAEAVLGEFYWKVEAGEQVQAGDFVAPPLMLSRETSYYKGNKGGEVNWSVGAYMEVKDVEKAFNVKDLPRPSNVAPNQPFKHRYIYKYWLAFTFAATVLAVLLTVTAGSASKPITQSVQFQPLPNADGTQAFFTEQQFHLLGRRNLYITAEAPVANSWVAMEGDLINDDTGLVQSFPLEISYSNGVEDGESWSEGSTKASTYVSGVPEGNYTLRLEAAWEKWQQPMTVNLTVEQNVTRGANFILALILLALGPIVVFIWNIIFESRRWSESMFSSSGGSSDEE
jgi:hypothetical protein